jgi:hypothetical protein
MVSITNAPPVRYPQQPLPLGRIRDIAALRRHPRRTILLNAIIRTREPEPGNLVRR